MATLATTTWLSIIIVWGFIAEIEIRENLSLFVFIFHLVSYSFNFCISFLVLVANIALFLPGQVMICVISSAKQIFFCSLLAVVAYRICGRCKVMVKVKTLVALRLRLELDCQVCFPILF